jgi:hypothetical protein
MSPLRLEAEYAAVVIIGERGSSSLPELSHCPPMSPDWLRVSAVGLL